MKNKEEIAFIIPTVSRSKQIRRLLKSIEQQNTLPKELIIVDGGDRDISDEIKGFGTLNIKYITSKPPSLTKQRNTGVKNISDSITLVGFLDDDIILGEDSLKNMLKFWETADHKVGGASFNGAIINFRKTGGFEREIFAKNHSGGKLLKTGFNSSIYSIESTKYVEWLLGGMTVWRRNVVEEFKFDEWFTGNAYCDDIDYSYRVAKKYKLMVVKEAVVKHIPSPIGLKQQYLQGKSLVINRIYFVKKYPEFSLILCYGANLGLLVKNLFFGIVCLNPRYLLKGIGILLGLIVSFWLPRQ